ncbi:hypothetical protein R1sor_005089 [Riccia sorocarpa]|uniref:Uncharacterized protein n=1 Tax=Riccia sorocarpa TaxID=122646 RepID=A0ABD3HJ54_9MARC
MQDSLSKNDAKCIAQAIVAKQQGLLELFFSLGIFINYTPFRFHRIIDTTRLLPEEIILIINEHRIYMSRADPMAFLISAPLRDIIWCDCNETHVFLHIRVSGVVQMFQFGTMHGNDICWDLQNHIYNRIEEDLLEIKKSEVDLEKLKKEEDYLGQVLEELDMYIADVAHDQILELKERIMKVESKPLPDKVKEDLLESKKTEVNLEKLKKEEDYLAMGQLLEELDINADVAHDQILELKERMIKLKVRSESLRNKVKDRLENLTTLRVNARSKLEELAKAKHGLEILPEEGCSKRRRCKRHSIPGTKAHIS